LGAFLGGTTRGGHQAFDSEALCLITPPNFGSGGGSCCPLIVVVALAEPNLPVTCGVNLASDGGSCFALMLTAGEPEVSSRVWAMAEEKNAPEPITMKKTSIPTDMSLKFFGNKLLRKYLKRVSIILLGCLIPKWIT